MNNWVWVVLGILLIVTIAFYLYPKQEIKTNAEITYSAPIGPTQEPPSYRLNSKPLEVANG